MNILILGAGQVGSSIAQFLNNDSSISLTIVDSDKGNIDKFKDLGLDLKTIEGNASYPSVLLQAGIEDMDIVLAVTGSDETNIMACQICKAVWSTPKQIARVRAAAYLEDSPLNLFKESNAPFAVDAVISPEAAVTDQFVKLIQHRGASEVLTFCQGSVEVLVLKAVANSPLTGKCVECVQNQVSEYHASVVAWQSKKDFLPTFFDAISMPKKIAEDDEVYIVCERERVGGMLESLGFTTPKASKVVIAGGGNIGERLAKELREQKHASNIVVIDRDSERCDHLCETLGKKLVLNGDVTDERVFVENSLTNADFFCAITDDDEVNVMSALLAKQLGVSTVLALIKKQEYLDIVGHTAIDVGVSPQQSTASAIFGHVQEVVPERIQSLNDSRSQILEIEVKKGHKRQIVGTKLVNLKLPNEARLIAVNRNSDIILGDDLQNVVFEEEDHLVIFVSDFEKVRAVEKRFRLEQTFYE